MNIIELDIEGCWKAENPEISDKSLHVENFYSRTNHQDLFELVKNDNGVQYIVPIEMNYCSIVRIGKNTPFTFDVGDENGILIKPILDDVGISISISDGNVELHETLGRNAQIFVRNDINVNIDSCSFEYQMVVFSRNFIQM